MEKSYANIVHDKSAMIINQLNKNSPPIVKTKADDAPATFYIIQISFSFIYCALVASAAIVCTTW